MVCALFLAAVFFGPQASAKTISNNSTDWSDVPKLIEDSIV